MKTEAERRFEAYCALRTKDPNDNFVRALLYAIFDPLPPEPEPEPEPVKSLGQVAHDEWSRDSACEWADATNGRRAAWESAAQAVVTEHESRRPKPTVEEVAQLFRACGRAHKGNYADYARRVFPLFGVTP